MSDIVVRDDNQNMTFDNMRAMAESISKSGLFAMKTPEQALALMLISQANGQHPARACQEYSIIQGRAAMSSQAMLAKFQSAGGKVRWLTRTDTEVEAEFSHASGGSLTVKWTIEQAKRIGLAGKDNWRNYPRQMLSARVIAEGVRAVLPGVILGFYAPEEVADFVDEQPAKSAPAIQLPRAKPAHEPVSVKVAEPVSVEIVDVQEAKPEPVIVPEPTPSPEPTVVEGHLEVVTHWEEVRTKEGKSAKGPWCRYYVKADDGEYYSTFSKKLGEKMDSLCGLPATIVYTMKDGPKGPTREVVDVFGMVEEKKTDTATEVPF